MSGRVSPFFYHRNNISTRALPPLSPQSIVRHGVIFWRQHEGRIWFAGVLSARPLVATTSLYTV